jgi:hypothetical protein
MHGYFQVPLDHESSLLTTFIIDEGKYRYTVAPMGLNSSSDAFCVRTDEAMREFFAWLLKIIDDMLVQGRTLQEVFRRLRLVLQRCRETGIMLSLSKLEVGQSIKFAGFTVCAEGVRPDPSKLATIRGFPTPKTVTDLKSFLGLANQLGAFLPDLAHATVNLRGQLKKENAFLWLHLHDEEFSRAKELLCSSVLVKPFDSSLATELLTDASRLFGLGYALLQRETNGQPRLIQCGSCSLTPAQRNYATIELEASAILWGAVKCNHYLRGLALFDIFTDHKPLVGAFKKPLAAMGNDRLQRIRERLLAYSFELSWTPGKEHRIADALSRAPYFPAEAEMEVTIFGVLADDPAMALISNAVGGDESYLAVRDAVRSEAECPLAAYRYVFEELLLQDDLLVAGTRLVVPKDARRRILDLLHLSHSGVSKTSELARQLYTWPGMDNDIKVRVGTCSACIALLPAQQHESVLAERATYPMERVGADLFDLDTVSFLVMVDRYSGYPFVARLSTTTTAAVCAVLLRWFCDFGLPCSIKTDGGPQFRGPFKEFCQEYGILHYTSSPYNPRSNGLAEAAVKSMKHLLTKVGTDVNGPEFRLSLLEWRNTPRTDGWSPAYGFFGRHLRTQLPGARVAPSADVAGPEFAAARQRAAPAGAAAAGGHDLPPLAVGDLVHYRHKPDSPWCVGGEVAEALQGGRSYWIETPGGGFRRGRVHLRLAVGPVAEAEPALVVVETKPQRAKAVKDDVVLRRSRRVQQQRKKVTFQV